VAGYARRALLRAGLGAAAAALWASAGCGLEAPARSRGDAPLTLLADAAFAPAAQALANAFAASAGGGPRPIVEVAEPDLPTVIQAMLAGDASVQADVVLATPAVRDTVSASSLMLNVAPALQDTQIAAGLYPALLQYGASGARQLLMPAFRDPMVVFYNSDAFARAGVDPPAPDWTLDKLVLLCQQLRQKAPWLAAPLANATNFFDLELVSAFVVGFGGQMLRAAQTGYTPTFSTPAGIYGFQSLAKLHPFEPAHPAAVQPVDLFAEGEVALHFGHHRDVAPLAARIGDLFAWDVAPLPAFAIRRAQPVAADGLAAVTTAPDRRAAAITLALFAGTPAAQLALARTGLGVPALRALASSNLWRAAGPQLDNEVFVANTDADFVVARPLYAQPIAQALQTALADIVRGYAAYDALQAASTYSEYTLATFQD
jgi:ABC-type glycerol-3-phosphate transport system substrate-binding protein